VDFKDISLIVEFLGALNDEAYDKTIPLKVPSKLKVGGNIQNEGN
jgi:cytochrome c peroxidase